MHPVIMGSLEEYLSGALRPSARQQFESHLATCRACREEFATMQQISLCFHSLKATEPPAVSPVFVARVMQSVQGQRPVAASFWNLFSLEPGFGKRVAFASLLTLAALGTFLVSREIEYAPGPVPMEALMATDGLPGSHSDRDRMLVTLTSYEP
jgi:anti-sigma factor RsiW